MHKMCEVCQVLVKINDVVVKQRSALAKYFRPNIRQAGESILPLQVN